METETTLGIEKRRHILRQGGSDPFAILAEQRHVSGMVRGSAVTSHDASRLPPSAGMFGYTSPNVPRAANDDSFGHAWSVAITLSPFARPYIRRHGWKLYIWGSPFEHGWTRSKASVTAPPDVAFRHAVVIDEVKVFVSHDLGWTKEQLAETNLGIGLRLWPRRQLVAIEGGSYRGGRSAGGWFS